MQLVLHYPNRTGASQKNIRNEEKFHFTSTAITKNHLYTTGKTCLFKKYWNCINNYCGRSWQCFHHVGKCSACMVHDVKVVFHLQKCYKSRNHLLNWKSCQRILVSHDKKLCQFKQISISRIYQNERHSGCSVGYNEKIIVLKVKYHVH